MASLIESVRKLHGPKLIEHENGYDVDVICAECTGLQTQALEQASSSGEDWDYTVEVAHVPYPCATRVVAGTTAAEGKDDSARMRLEHLVVRREELEERMERLDAVIGLIRRDLSETSDEPDDLGGSDEELAEDTKVRSKQASKVAPDIDHARPVGSSDSTSVTDPENDFDF